MSTPARDSLGHKITTQSVRAYHVENPADTSWHVYSKPSTCTNISAPILYTAYSRQVLARMERRGSVNSSRGLLRIGTHSLTRARTNNSIAPHLVPHPMHHCTSFHHKICMFHLPNPFLPRWSQEASQLCTPWQKRRTSRGFRGWRRRARSDLPAAASSPAGRPNNPWLHDWSIATRVLDMPEGACDQLREHVQCAYVATSFAATSLNWLTQK